MTEAERKPRAPKGHQTVNGTVHPKGQIERDIICKKSGKRVLRAEQLSFGSTWNGKEITCPECGATTRIFFGAIYNNDYSYYKHVRADQWYENGHWRGERYDPTKDKEPTDAGTDPRF